MAKPELIIIHETTLKSWARDASTFALFAALISLGVYLDSGAMQWMGAIIAFITVMSKATGMHKAARKTIPQARAYLDELEASL